MIMKDQLGRNVERSGSDLFSGINPPFCVGRGLRKTEETSISTANLQAENRTRELQITNHSNTAFCFTLSNIC